MHGVCALGHNGFKRLFAHLAPSVGNFSLPPARQRRRERRDAWEQEAVEFMPGAIAVLDHLNRLKALWLRLDLV